MSADEKFPLRSSVIVPKNHSRGQQHGKIERVWEQRSGDLCPVLTQISLAGTQSVGLNI